MASVVAGRGGGLAAGWLVRLRGCAAENLTIGLLETPLFRIRLRRPRGRSRAVAARAVR